MELTKAKAYFSLGVITLAIMPKALYVASDKYSRAYNQGSAYMSELKERALSTVGLETIKPLPVEVEKTLELVIEKEAARFYINPRFLSALVKHESVEDADALSFKGAIGYAQIMPDNYKRCGLKKKSELWDMEKNVRCGAQIISEELKTYNGDTLQALAAYNGGPKCVNTVKGADPKCSESVRHAKEVLRLFANASV